MTAAFAAVTTALLDYVRDEVAARDEEARLTAEITARYKAQGYRFISGGQVGLTDDTDAAIEHYVDAETGQTIYHGPCRGGDNCSHLDHLGEKAVHVDYIGNEAWEAAGQPQLPSDLPSQFEDAIAGIDTDQLRSWLA